MKKWLIIIAIVGLLIAHQDYWTQEQWERKELVFGFLPYTIAYHALVSIAASLVWIFVCFFCWPKELEKVRPKENNSGNEVEASTEGAQA